MANQLAIDWQEDLCNVLQQKWKYADYNPRHANYGTSLADLDRLLSGQNPLTNADMQGKSLASDESLDAANLL